MVGFLYHWSFFSALASMYRFECQTLRLSQMFHLVHGSRNYVVFLVCLLNHKRTLLASLSQGHKVVYSSFKHSLLVLLTTIFRRIFFLFITRVGFKYPQAGTTTPRKNLQMKEVEPKRGILFTRNNPNCKLSSLMSINKSMK